MCPVCVRPKIIVFTIKYLSCKFAFFRIRGIGGPTTKTIFWISKAPRINETGKKHLFADVVMLIIKGGNR